MKRILPGLALAGALLILAAVAWRLIAGCREGDDQVAQEGLAGLGGAAGARIAQPAYEALTRRLSPDGDVAITQTIFNSLHNLVRNGYFQAEVKNLLQEYANHQAIPDCARVDFVNLLGRLNG